LSKTILLQNAKLHFFLNSPIHRHLPMRRQELVGSGKVPISEKSLMGG